MTWSPSFDTAQPKIEFNDEVLISYPVEHTLLVTLNRPKKLNTFFTELSGKLSQLFDWADNEPQIWCIVITGAGRAFSCGGDLEAWLKATQEGKGGIVETDDNVMNKTGAAGLSRRVSKTPIIAAVNGLCFGGGFEIVANCDLVIASEKAQFCLPEVKRGIYASQGALPRLLLNVGRQRASEIALLGLPITPQRGVEFGFVNKVVPHEKLMDAALEWAAEICKNSPDAVILTKMALNEAMADIEPAVSRCNNSEASKNLSSGENQVIGMSAFMERKQPKWVSSKL